MNIAIDPLQGFYLISAILLLAVALAVYPTLRERSKEKK